MEIKNHSPEYIVSSPSHHSLGSFSFLTDETLASLTLIPFCTRFKLRIISMHAGSYKIVCLDYLLQVTSSAPDWLDPSLQLHVPLVDVDKVLYYPPLVI